MSIMNAVLTALFVMSVVFAILAALIGAIKLLSVVIQRLESENNSSSQNQ